MSFSSLFSRIFKKRHSVGALNRAEEKAKRFFTPSDWFIVGAFFFLMLIGAGIMLGTLSVQLSEEVPVFGGTHTEGIVGSPRFINPLLAISDADRDVTQLVFGGLMKAEGDGLVTPHLAESYSISEDGLSYTFVLKDNITFHDGTPITAEDVVFTVQSAKNPDIKSPQRANWEGVEVIALDEKTVSFTLLAPYALFLENTTLGVLPKHLWGSLKVEEFPFSDLNTNPIGSGFYRVGSVKKNSSGVPIEYRLTASNTTGQRPFIKNFVFRFYPNNEALEGALANGDVDAAHSLIPNEDFGDLTVEEAVFARVFGVFFNQNQQELFADETVRQALDQVLDKKLIVDTVISGYGTALSGPLPPKAVDTTDVGLTDVSTQEERFASAENLLIENGWERGEDGVFVKGDDEPVRLAFTLTTANASELKHASELVAEKWRALGAEVTLQFFDQNDLNLEVIRPRKYDALLFGLVVGRELDLFAFWHSSQRNDPGLNIALYANISADKHLEDARDELDPKERRAAAERAAGEIKNETAAIFLYAPHFTYVHEARLAGVSLGTISTPSDRFSGMERWYVNTERVWPFFNN